MNATRLFAAIPFAFALFIGGCAGGNPENAESSESAVSSQSPITVENYLEHPTIQAIDDERHQIDRTILAREAQRSCNGEKVKWSEADGRIRKLVETRVEGNIRAERWAYYRADGKLAFVFAFDSYPSFTAPETPETVALRVYYGANNDPIFQVERNAGVDSLASGELSALFADPHAWYASPSCEGEGRR